MLKVSFDVVNLIRISQDIQIVSAIIFKHQLIIETQLLWHDEVD